MKETPLFSGLDKPAPRVKQVYERPGLPSMDEKVIKDYEVEVSLGEGKYEGKRFCSAWLPTEHLPKELKPRDHMLIGDKEVVVVQRMFNLWPGAPLREGVYGWIVWMEDV